MAHGITHLKNISVVSGNMRAFINLERINANLANAQYWLDGQVMNDMVPYMPMQTNTLINITRAQSAALQGTGTVVAAAPPYGRFQYMGVVMVDPATNSPFARPGAKKVVTERPLNYSNPKATPKWFDTAKKNHGQNWINEVKRRAGGK